MTTDLIKLWPTSTSMHSLSFLQVADMVSVVPNSKYHSLFFTLMKEKETEGSPSLTHPTIFAAFSMHLASVCHQSNEPTALVTEHYITITWSISGYLLVNWLNTIKYPKDPAADLWTSVHHHWWGSGFYGGSPTTSSQPCSDIIEGNLSSTPNTKIPRTLTKTAPFTEWICITATSLPCPCEQQPFGLMAV